MTPDKFILQEKLNESATTTVYKAHQSALERTVLLKILHRHLADDHQLVARFEREARACALVRSDNIVQVYDLTEIDGTPAIVMEFVEGTSLKDVLARDGALSAERTRTIAVEALRALEAAHARGVIHRDIKPGNILVTPAGHIKITDFGLAAVTASPTVTMEGAVLGTPAYLPPELIRGEAADERSDLFSLGATLIETVSGTRIFGGATYSACIHNILHFDPAAVDALVADALLARVIKKLMQPQRSLRYQSASEALDELEGAEAPSRAHSAGSAGPAAAPSEGMSVSSHAQADGEPPAVSTRSRRARIAALTAVIAVLCYAGFSYWSAMRSGSSTGSPARSGDESRQSVTPAETMRAQQPDVSARTAPSQVLPPSVKEEGAAQTGMDRSASSNQPADRNVKKSAGIDSAFLAVTCVPWAKVFLDSQYLGETPIGGAVAIRPGTHTVSFTNPQFTPIVKTITAQPGGRVTAAGNFFESAGYVVINVVPWADVFIDDQYRDTTPIDKPMAVSAGRRTIRLHNPGFTDAVYEVTVPKKDTLRLSYSLTRKK